MSSKEIILIGYSGHGIVVAEAAIASDMDLKYYTEKEILNSNPFELDYIGFEGSDSFDGWNGNHQFILGIGDNTIRQKAANLVLSKGNTLCNVIHNSASIAQKVTVGTGNFIARNVSISPMVKIGDFCILNTGCIIEHDCVLESAVHIAPGAVLAGNVIVGERTFVGANSVIKQGVRIGKDVIIGAGSVVINDVADNIKIVGNPAKKQI